MLVPFPTLFFPQQERAPGVPPLPRCIFPLLLPQGAFPCSLSLSLLSCNLFPELPSSMGHFFYLCDFLNKLSLRIGVLALNSLSRDSSIEVAKPRLTPGVVFPPSAS